jgi:uncharacterized membrane protein YeaQ/YmgE (transglycosylase-associated protein family)
VDAPADDRVAELLARETPRGCKRFPPIKLEEGLIGGHFCGNPCAVELRKLVIGIARHSPWFQDSRAPLRRHRFTPGFTSSFRLSPFCPVKKISSIVKCVAILGNFLQANDGGKIMIHLIWYIVVGLIAGVIAKSVMHVHMTIFWTIVLGIIGSIIGGAVTHMFSHPTTGRFHPAGLIFSTLGAILVLYVCIRLNIHFPRVL